MGIIIRKSFKSLIANYAGVLLGAFNMLYLFPEFLSKTEMGLRETMIAYSYTLAYFAQLSLPQIIIKFLPYFQSKEKKNNGFFLGIIFVSTLGFVFFGSLFYLFKNQILDYYKESPIFAEFFYWVLPMFYGFMMINILESYLRANLKIVIPSIIHEVFLRLMTSILVLLYAFNWVKFDWFIYLLVCTYVLSACLMLFYIKYLKQFFISLKHLKIGKTKIKEIANFSLWLFIGGAGYTIANKLDIFMLGRYIDLASVGVYGVAFYIGTIIEMPRRTISSITSPILAQAWKKNDLAHIKELYYKSAINQFLIGALVFSLVWINIDSLFALMPNGEQFIEGIYVVFFIGLTRLINMSTGVNAEIIVNSKHYKFNSIAVFILAILMYFFNKLLIPIYGLTGAASATCLAMFLYNIILVGYAWYKFKILPFRAKSFLAFALFLLVFIIGNYLPSFSGDFLRVVFSIVYKSLIVSLLLAFLVIYFKLSEDVYAIFKRFFPNKKL